MLASSFFFGRNVREKRDKDHKAANKDAVAVIRAFKSDHVTDQYISWGTEYERMANERCSNCCDRLRDVRE
jgi:hypothetical protein